MLEFGVSPCDEQVSWSPSQLFLQLGNSSKRSNTSIFSYPEMIMAKQVWRIGLPLLLCVGTVGNILSIMVLCRQRLRKITTMFYLAVLALADLAVLYTGLLRLWLDNAFSVYLRLHSDTACKVHTFFVYFTLDFSVWILVAVTADRCICVSAPFAAKKWCTLRKARVVVVIIAVLLFLINMHYLFTVSVIFHSGESIAGDGFYTCYTSENAQTAFFLQKVWPWIDLFVACFVPFIVMFVCNLLIIRQLVLSARKLREHAENKLDCNVNRSRRRTQTSGNAGHHLKRGRNPSLPERTEEDLERCFSTITEHNPQLQPKPSKNFKDAKEPKERDVDDGLLGTCQASSYRIRSQNTATNQINKAQNDKNSDEDRDDDKGQTSSFRNKSQNRTDKKVVEEGCDDDETQKQSQATTYLNKTKTKAETKEDGDRRRAADNDEKMRGKNKNSSLCRNRNPNTAVRNLGTDGEDNVVGSQDRETGDRGRGVRKSQNSPTSKNSDVRTSACEQPTQTRKQQRGGATFRKKNDDTEKEEEQDCDEAGHNCYEEMGEDCYEDMKDDEESCDNEDHEAKISKRTRIGSVREVKVAENCACSAQSDSDNDDVFLPPSPSGRNPPVCQHKCFSKVGNENVGRYADEGFSKYANERDSEHVNKESSEYANKEVSEYANKGVCDYPIKGVSSHAIETCSCCVGHHSKQKQSILSSPGLHPSEADSDTDGKLTPVSVDDSFVNNVTFGVNPQTNPALISPLASSIKDSQQSNSKTHPSSKYHGLLGMKQSSQSSPSRTKEGLHSSPSKTQESPKSSLSKTKNNPLSSPKRHPSSKYCALSGTEQSPQSSPSLANRVNVVNNQNLQSISELKRSPASPEPSPKKSASKIKRSEPSPQFGNNSREHMNGEAAPANGVNAEPNPELKQQFNDQSNTASTGDRKQDNDPDVESEQRMKRGGDGGCEKRGQKDEDKQANVQQNPGQSSQLELPQLHRPPTPPPPALTLAHRRRTVTASTTSQNTDITNVQHSPTNPDPSTPIPPRSSYHRATCFSTRTHLPSTSTLASTTSSRRRRPRTTSETLQQQRRSGIPSLTLMLLTVNTVFMLLTAPIVVFVIGYYYWLPGATKKSLAQLSLGWSLVNILQYTNNAVHFFLYCLTGPRFRGELADMCRSLMPGKAKARVDNY